ncbi:MAG: antitoxin [Parachlamydiaceae bacterium]|nr:antitoxin [Parachlamydiaceae bacterium]
MSASNFNLRNVAPDVMLLLKKEAAKQKISINSLILKILEHGLGISHSTKKIVFHDLDHLAGTWTSKDKKEFDDHIKSFENIDRDLWL